MEIPSKYEPHRVERQWYDYWIQHNYFNSKPDDREPYTIVIPPPNVTGVLHMGHMLNNTIQDVLIRRARLMGKNACWVPGTDHASIATEAKVVAKLKEQGIDKKDITREEFLKHAWDWTHESVGHDRPSGIRARWSGTLRSRAGRPRQTDRWRWPDPIGQSVSSVCRPDQSVAAQADPRAVRCGNTRHQRLTHVWRRAESRCLCGIGSW